MVFVLLMLRPRSGERDAERSDLRESAVDEQLGTRYETGIVGGEEGNRLCDLVGGANPAKRSRPGNVLAIRVDLLITHLEFGFVGRCDDDSGGDHVDADFAAF